jgi:hypothetical protein
MHLFGWMIADPICSIFIAILIALSVSIGTCTTSHILYLPGILVMLDLPAIFVFIAVQYGVFELFYFDSDPL